jgi:hypothetical protein
MVARELYIKLVGDILPGWFDSVLKLGEPQRRRQPLEQT